MIIFISISFPEKKERTALFETFLKIPFPHPQRAPKVTITVGKAQNGWNWALSSQTVWVQIPALPLASSGALDKFPKLLVP